MAAMLPAICVQVPGGLAASGSLVAGVVGSRQIGGLEEGWGVVNNGTRGFAEVGEKGGSGAGGGGTMGEVGFGMVQIAIGVSVGLYMSTLVMWPFVRRGGGRGGGGLAV